MRVQVSGSKYELMACNYVNIPCIFQPWDQRERLFIPALLGVNILVMQAQRNHSPSADALRMEVI